MRLGGALYSALGLACAVSGAKRLCPLPRARLIGAAVRMRPIRGLQGTDRLDRASEAADHLVESERMLRVSNVTYTETTTDVALF